MWAMVAEAGWMWQQQACGGSNGVSEMGNAVKQDEAKPVPQLLPRKSDKINYLRHVGESNTEARTEYHRYAVGRMCRLLRQQLSQ